MKQTLSEQAMEQRMVQRMWLNYFNRYLYENGAISENEYKKMIELIAGYHAAKKKT